MNRIVIFLGAIVLVALLYVMPTYNGFATRQQNVEAAWSQVQNQYQRRSDLIPNLVNVVKGYAEHEKSTLEAVTEARAKATSITVDVSKLATDPEAQKKLIQAQDALSASLGRLLAVSEKYPDLKANQLFINLQAQIEGTENRIVVARRDAIKATQVYNTSLVRMPGSLIAMFAGFMPVAYYQASDVSTPKVDFSNKK